MINSIYNSESYTKQKPNTHTSFFSKEQPLGFSKASSVVSVSCIENLKPSDFREMEKDTSRGMFWDEKALRQESLSAWSQLYFFLATIAKGFLYFVVPLVTLFSTLPFFNPDIPITIELFIETIVIVSYYFVPSAVIYFHFVLVSRGYLFLAPFLKSKRSFDLSRETGMVTLYKKGNKVRFTHPFIEFDCVLMSSPSHQGHLSYSLFLVHRYMGYSFGVPIGTLIGPNQPVGEYYRLWNMIQRYMDVSQPIPDIMILEPARPKDPVTAAHDEQTGRKPRYWRDMTDEEFEVTLSELRTKQRELPTTGPSIDIFE
ncbi:hypothetical protein HC752_22695 [Vibrio sp. S9_S30]|uniref:hypothetical protein n=1 Tax=Vibrio sp. S9_S30 TaxID=2720226 RepID=UPI0016814B6B|nr:hypothetical protein [Vibrio sp. S9_S30]MBD1559749.1 hypothetical protein [Vibrio sp. S9_S30]